MPRMRPKPNATPAQIAFGINPATMALEHGLVKELLYWHESANRRVLELVEQAKALDIPAASVNVARLDELSGEGVHQGVVARIHRIPPIELGSVTKRVESQSLVVLLDGVTDPQNTGAVIRTAMAVGVDAIVLPERRGAHLTPGVHRASSGLSLIAPVARPMNIARALDLLKERGYWTVAAAQGEGSSDATTFDWPERTALIVGSEAHGIGHNVQQHSDFRVALPMGPGVESLNVGVAFGALAYLWRRQWPLAVATVVAEGGP